HQIIVDMGTHQTGKLLRARLAQLAEHERRFDLLVNTHVDSDHIAGVLSCVSHADEPVPGLEFADVWFNGREHLDGDTVPEPPGGLEPWGPAQ
ncbi:MBL fold metallo-hydrolase, partial [Staphylococcus aureus]|uniref:MBL fold metallo-hydrolase n=1 Tax=Staphylococcus aureus TaxID=1280 RepID=UPI00148F4B15